jgi:hypothetical protein
MDGEEHFSWGSRTHPRPYVESYDAQTATWKREL